MLSVSEMRRATKRGLSFKARRLHYRGGCIEERCSNAEQGVYDCNHLRHSRSQPDRSEIVVRLQTDRREVSHCSIEEALQRIRNRFDEGSVHGVRPLGAISPRRLCVAAARGFPGLDPLMLLWFMQPRTCSLLEPSAST